MQLLGDQSERDVLGKRFRRTFFIMDRMTIREKNNDCRKVHLNSESGNVCQLSINLSISDRNAIARITSVTVFRYTGVAGRREDKRPLTKGAPALPR